MRAWVVRRPGPIDSAPLELVDRPKPVPGPGELRVRVRACGVCRTDLHLAEGDLLPRRPGVVPGHEIVGIVDRLGPGASRFAEGDRVGIAWLRHTCGTCRFCLRGAENLCLTPRFTGWDDFGASAHLAAQIALADGATVHVLTRSADARRLALDLGAASAGDTFDEPPEPLDAAILFAPAGEIVPVALAALDRGGTLAIAGIHLTDIPTLRYQEHLFQERQVRSVTANTRQDAEDLLATAARIGIRVETAAYPLDRADVALRDLAHDRVNGAAVLTVTP
jgi:propanol-preferring alcohol dehydrogenase